MQTNETKTLNMFTYHCRFAMPTLKFCKKLLNMQLEQVFQQSLQCLFCQLITMHNKKHSN